MICTSKKRIFLIIYCSTLFLQTTIFLLNEYHQININHDIWYEKFAYNWVEKGSPRMLWSDSATANVVTKNPPQQGIYFNWRPIGYSVFLAAIMKMNFLDFKAIKSFFQIILYSLIPSFIFLIATELFAKYSIKNQLSILAAIIATGNPSFWVSHLQSLDTWFITLLTTISFYFLIKNYHLFDRKYFLALSLIVLFFCRPNGIFPFVFLLLIMLYNSPKSHRYLFLFPIMLIILSVVSWGIRNYVYFQKYDFTNSSIGYNLWLGNNQYSNDFFVKYIGDGTTIEDNIVPKYNTVWAFLKNYSEYQKDAFFKEQAWDFIKSHPMKTLENASWKVVGFWSPLRVRTGHWSDSRIKTILLLIYNTPLIVFSFFSVVTYFWRKEYKINKEKGVLILFMFLWMLPHLAFFSTSRFRTPIDFGLIILTIDFLFPFLSRFFDKLRTIKYKKSYAHY